MTFHRVSTGASLLVLALACLALSPAPASATETPKAEQPKKAKKAAMPAAPAEMAPAELPAIDVTARGEVRAALPEKLPATVVWIDKERIATEVNAPTTAAALKYLPSVEVRERYIGDRNGILSTRTTGTLESARSLVYGDGILLSNLLGNSYGYPPRWGAVSPWEIERIDMVYGPFSAAYPGNAMGGVAALTTRMPEKFEGHATLRGFAQPYSLYGTRETFPGWNGSLALGNRFENFAFWLGWDHLDARGQPMSWATANTPASSATRTGTLVTGATFDADPTNVARTVYGATSMDHTVQDMLKFKASWDFTDTLRATYTAGLWMMKANTSVDSYLTRVADGAAWAGNAADCKFSIASGARFLNYNGCMNPGQSESSHLLQGLQLKSNSGGTFDFEASLSAYNYLTDESRSASKYGTADISGTRTDMSGTGWYTGDLVGIWRPDVDLAGRHELSLGAHLDLYRYTSTSTNTSNWSAGTHLSDKGSSRGETRTSALHLQDSWKILPKWTLTAGIRGESWQASDGRNVSGATVLDYAARSAQTASPKLALAWAATDELLLRAAYGKAHRYPTVTELFQSSTDSAGNVLRNTPNLRPENIDAYELSGELTRGKTFGRLTGFVQNNADAIASQKECTDATCATTVTWNSNIGKVLIWGTEAVLEQRDAFVPGLDLRGSVTLAFSKILEDSANPALIGKEWQRIPRWRARAVATYRFDDKWSGSLGARYASGAYSNLDNGDTNWSIFGGNSPYFIADARVSYKVAEHWSLSLGVDNFTDAKAYVYHPYPQRTFFSEIKVDF